jgi:drug/metabolite transporter (DMT)-like permease
VPTLAISFWMTVLTAVVMTVLSVIFERRSGRPQHHHLGAILFNAVGVFGYAHAAWFYLARGLPPVASTLSVMFIPVLGVFSGALWLGEVLHWQDWAAVVLMVVAIASVLLVQVHQPWARTAPARPRHGRIAQTAAAAPPAHAHRSAPG